MGVLEEEVNWLLDICDLNLNSNGYLNDSLKNDVFDARFEENYVQFLTSMAKSNKEV
jgi:hypothetical protein